MNEILNKINEKSLLQTPEMLISFSEFLSYVKNHIIDRTDSDMVDLIAFSLQKLAENIRQTQMMIDEYQNTTKPIPGAEKLLI